MYTELLVTHLGEYWTHHMCWEIAKNALVGLITFCLGPSISSTPPPSTSFMCGIMITFQIVIMKRKFKQWWSTIPPISTKWTITSHLKHTKSPLIRRWISRSWFRIGTNMGGWTSKWDLNPPFLIIGSPMAIHCTYINNQYKTIYLQNCIYLVQGLK